MFSKKNKESKAPLKNTLEKSQLPFLSSNYQKINVARLQHLDSLGLSISNVKVIDLGAGIGDHTIFYLFKNCQVLPVEGREELVSFISDRFGIKSIQLNFEKESEGLMKLGSFDIIHCYGLLYHLSNPAEFLSYMSRLGKTLFLETCVSEDSSQDPINLITEDKSNATQAISGTGCRPTRRWVFDELKKYFPYVYLPLTQPKSEQFPLKWNVPNMGSQNKRAVFVASSIEISNKNLSSDFITEYATW